MTKTQQELYQNLVGLWLDDFIGTDAFLELVHYWVMGD